MPNAIASWASYQFKDKKLNTPLGWFLMMLCGFGIAYTTARVDYSITGILVISIIGVYALLISLRYPLAGLYITVAFSTLFALPGRMFYIASPIGLLVEVFTYVLWIAVLGNHAAKRDTSGFWKNPITIVYLLIFAYYLLEIANPSMYSLQGWMFFVRKQISFILYYYICYVLLDSFDKMKRLLNFFIVIVFLIAAYGIKQQWFGLANFEKNWLYSDPLAWGLFFQGGFLRKFSFLTDPAAFGVICAVFAMLTLILGLRATSNKKRYLMYFVAIVCLVASTYSGSRTCNLMIVAGLVAYGVFTLNEKRTYVLIIASFMIGVFLLFGPFQYNPVINRVKTTFYSHQDASAMLRDHNRGTVQPYILTHPIGGGINTSGSEGAAFNPGHPLSNFPPDSGYLKILVEQGWLGFALNLAFYFVFLKQGLEGFYQAKNAEIKNIYIAITVALFSLVVGQYSQVAIAQYPLMLFYYAAMVMLLNLIKYDTLNTETNVT
jgi:putative inorganic carbon (HCO3(-)) transporter